MTEPVIPAPGDTLDVDLIRKIIESAPNILYVYDVQAQKSLFQTRRFGELLDQPDARPEMPSDWQAFIHEEDALRFHDHRERLKTIAPGETLRWEFRMRDGNGNYRWFLSRDALLSSDTTGKPRLIVGNALDITEQKMAEQDKDILAGEMRHRAKNLITVIESIGRLSRPKNRPEIDAFLDTFMGRLTTLLRTGDVVLSSSSRNADLREVIELALTPFRDVQAPHRFILQGPPVAVFERTAGGIALAVHELATNAIKYGALSVPQGAVTIAWSLSDADPQIFALEWKESGGPAVTPPTAEGFGGRVIRYSIAHEPHSRIALDYLPDGVRCEFIFEYRVE